MVGMLMSGLSIGLLFAAVTHLVDGRHVLIYHFTPNPRMRIKSASDKGGVVIPAAVGPKSIFSEGLVTLRTGLMA